MRMKTVAGSAAVAIFAVMLAGCSTFGKQNVGIAAGGATGAIVGSALFDGSPVGIAAGAIGGALAGNAIAKDTK